MLKSLLKVHFFGFSDFVMNDKPAITQVNIPKNSKSSAVSSFDTGIASIEMILNEVCLEVQSFLYNLLLEPEFFNEILERMNYLTRIPAKALNKISKSPEIILPSILPVPTSAETPRSWYFLMVHNAFENVLSYIRKKETSMRIFNSPGSLRVFTEEELVRIFEFARQKVVEMSSLQIGILNERFGIYHGIIDPLVEQIRKLKLEEMIFNDVISLLKLDFRRR